MTEATAPLPALELPVTLGERIARQDAALARLEILLEQDLALLRSLGQCGAEFPPDGAIALITHEYRLAEVQGELRESRESRDREVRLETVQEILGRAAAAQAPVPEPAPRRARHRAGKPATSRALRSVPVILAASAAWQAVRSHAPAAVVKPAAATLKLVTGHLAASGAVAATAVAAAVLVPASPVSPLGSGPSPAASAPSAGLYGATLLPGGIPPGQIAAALTRPQGARTRTLTVLPSLSLPSPLPSYVPPGGPAPSGGQDPGSQPAPAQGTLSVSTTALDATGTGTGTLTLTCSGGPCDWHVVVGGPVSADVRQGSLDDGGSAVVTVTADPSALMLDGSGTVTVWPGDIAVTVSWSAPVVPAVNPSPVDTTLPSAAASAP